MYVGLRPRIRRLGRHGSSHRELSCSAAAHSLLVSSRRTRTTAQVDARLYEGVFWNFIRQIDKIDTAQAL
eukprot:5261256-Pleurochrysis_carterae.AAC.1